uniref:Reverse transcriptase domain-containing protein n=1 Tax=Tanacetum cinerariifolium TaxID=118510 RepID=A0A699H618_TANCI|nr:reverse transcriptase domain-containing protein [Tanacetum cinerariifolium]
MPDKGPTTATTIVDEILGNPSTRLAYKRNSLTLQMQEKLKEVKARLNFEGCPGRNSRIQEKSQHSESRTPNVRGEHRRGRRSDRSRSMSESPERTSVSFCLKCDRSESPRHKPAGTSSRRTKLLSESDDSEGGHWKSRSRKQKSRIEEDDLSQPWVCEETGPFTHRIRYFDFPKKTRLPNNVKTYDGSDDPEDHLKNFQATAKVERHVKGAPECMRISGFMHIITNLELIKRLHENISKSVDEMMRVTTTFLRGEVAASNHMRKKTQPVWKQQEAGIFFFEKKETSGISRDQSGDVTREKDGAEGPMIIEAEIGGHFIHRIYVDGGSASEILYKHCFNRLRPEVKNQMVPATAPLIGFSGEIIWPMGQILLPVKIGDAEHFISTWMNFGVVSSPSPWIIPLECTMVFGPEAPPSDVIRAAKERIKVAIHPEYPEQTIAIGSTLTEEGPKALCELLRCNLYVFAWKPKDMTGVPRHLAEHRLNVQKGCLPVRQKKRSQAPERNKAIQEEWQNL